jgi:hypothetical protein
MLQFSMVRAKIKKVKKHIENLSKNVRLPDIDKITNPDLDKIKVPESHKAYFKKVHNMLFEKPVLKFVILLLLIFAMNFVVKIFPRSAEWAGYLFIILVVLVMIYFVVLIISLVRNSFKKLLSAQNMFVLITSYFFFILGLILLLSLAFNAVELTGHGYLTYGQCSDAFQKNMISEDPMISHDYIYFSAVTFFTVGYGDVCPMGWNKILSLVTAFIGHFVSVVIMFMVLNFYLQRKNTENGK